MNTDSINAPKIARQVDELKRLRAAPAKTLPMGWADGDVSPVTANALSKAGLARIDTTPAGKTVTAL